MKVVNPYWGKGIISHILNRVHRRNKNYIILCVGAPGSGKSYAMLVLGEQLDPHFDINNVVFKSKDAIIEILASAEGKGKLKRGSVIIFDEGGLDLSKREWYARSSRALVQCLQSQRFLNLIMIFTVPDESYIDSGIIPLVHLKISMTDNIDFKKKISYAKPFLIVRNPFIYSRKMQKPYYTVYPKKISKEGIFSITRIHFHLPSKKLVEAYERRKKEFFIAHNKMNLLRVEDYEDRRARKVYMLYEEVKAEVLSDPETYMKEFRDGTKRIILEYLRMLPILNAHKTCFKLMRDPEIREIVASPLTLKQLKRLREKPQEKKNEATYK